MVFIMLQTIQVTYKYTDNFEEALLWIEELGDTIAIDFECCSRYSDEEKEAMRDKLRFVADWEEKRLLTQAIESDGLSHHSLKVPYHLSLADNPKNAIVLVLPDETIRTQVTRWLIDTERLIVLHNASYDLQIIKWYTGRLPKRFFDTMIAVKVLTNQTEKFKAPIGLKDIMKSLYGEWALAKDDFNIRNMYNERAIKYNATDSCACMLLYKQIQESLCTQ